MTNKRLWIALACYAVLSITALFLLEGKTLQVILVLMVGLAAKSWIATLHNKG